MVTNVQGNSETNPGANLGIGGSAAGNSSGFVIQFTRQQIVNAINSGKVVQWLLDGTRGASRAGYCAVCTGDAVTYVGMMVLYAGTPDFIVRGNVGLGFVSATFAGSKNTVTLPGSPSATVMIGGHGIDADDYAETLLIKSGDLGA
jgi:hypothetical protein